MKKTLMVLSFAFCATFAFAQTNAVKAPNRASNAVAAPVFEETSQQSGFTGSIFTKDGEIFACDFSNGTPYTTGTVGAGQQIGGATTTQHTRSTYWSQWQRVTDTTAATRAAMVNEGHYPVLGNYFNFNMFSGVQSNTPNNGFMIMSMIDDYTGWGGDGTTGNFNAYIAFNNFSSVGESLIRVRFFQYYRAFNSDQCWIDYSTDGTTWNALEINVQGIDVNVNNNWVGWKAVTLPHAVGNQSTVYLRLRYEESTGNGGYWWMVDDFTVLPAPDVNLTFKTNEYFEGFYQMIPQNLQLPIVWNVNFVNDGKNAHDNVTGSINTWMDGDAAATAAVSVNVGAVPSDPFTNVSILTDPLGWYDDTATYHGWGYTGNPHGTAGYLPTANLGVGHWYGDVTSSLRQHAYDSLTFDTLRYTVNYDPSYHNGRATWARDNGAVAKFSYFAAGLVGPNTYSTDKDQTMWSEQNYGVFVSYVTGNEVPAGWKILGVELVAATEEGMHAAGSKIVPVLRRDSMDGSSLFITGVPTGASTYTVKSTDVFSNSEYADLTYLTPADNYNTVFLSIPNQPELRPNSAYRIGYMMAEEGNFAVATQGNWYYTLDDTTLVRFWNEPGMGSYGHYLDIANRYTTMVYDPYDGEYHMFGVHNYPMIRMIVGPGFYVPKAGFSFQCDNEEEGAFLNTNFNSVCGSVDSIPLDGSATYYIMPAEGYEIDKVWIDGVETTDYETVDDPEDGITYGILSFENIQAGHALRCSFKVKVGIDHVSGVSMKLQPNPATSNVNITLKGVTGNVNMALIDMSGRVVTTSQFNAENGTNINVSNLAKGAYFVRITNDKFSKVEKLIVR